MNDNIHDITSIPADVANEIDEVLEKNTFAFDVRPFWKSTIIRFGIVIVAVTAVKTAGKVIIARNNARLGI